MIPHDPTTAPGIIGCPNHNLADYGHLLVRRAICRDDWISEKIFELAANSQRLWDYQEWRTVEAELKASNLRIRDWLILYT